MARLTVYVPNEMAERAGTAGLDVSALTQRAIVAVLEENATATWLAGITDRHEVRHDGVRSAIDVGRDDF
ncbi:antitoxin [Nocardia mangyaensis]|uniref:Antitoxin n=1 Tax=Nocardia mangyaensis TaxID=2213200 RepID=A0A1J0VY80_9NOCA|nr:antitoxin [Nocardia mangyaensis]APE36957.1 antitoxin [Nocardia mangyaensis]